MHTIEYKNPAFNKESWGNGEWQDEPDKKQWIDKETGLPCLIVRNKGGALCGYVGLPSSHSLHGVEYNDTHESIKLLWEKAKNESIGKRGIISLFCMDENSPSLEVVFNVHGSLTFSGKCRKHENECEGICHKVEEGEDDNIWWFGFDCAHAGDISPAYETNRLYRVDGDTYKNIAYVTSEVESLAKQLASIAA